jgi:hypothetical protein
MDRLCLAFAVVDGAALLGKVLSDPSGAPQDFGLQFSELLQHRGRFRRNGPAGIRLLRLRLTVALARHRRRHRCLLDLARTALRARHEPALSLAHVVGGGAEPAFKPVTGVAGEVVDDHGTLRSRNCAAVGKARQLRANFGYPRQVDLREPQPGLIAAHVEQHLAPGIDHQRVPIRPATVLVQPHLRGGDDKGAGFNCPRPLQYVPVGLPGGDGERRRNRDDVAALPAERLEKRGKAQIVTHRQAEPAERGVRRRHLFAGRVGGRLTPALARGKGDIEHVDLVVASDDFAFGVDHERTVGPATVVAKHRERSERDPQPGAGRRLAHLRQHRVVGLCDDLPGRPAAVAIEQPRHFRCEQHRCSALRRVSDSPDERFGVRLRLDAAGHLQDGDARQLRVPAIRRAFPAGRARRGRRFHRRACHR